MTFLEALAAIGAPTEIGLWAGTRTTTQALRDCPRPEWVRWIRNADIYAHRYTL